MLQIIAELQRIIKTWNKIIECVKIIKRIGVDGMGIILIFIGIVLLGIMLKRDKFTFKKYSKYKWIMLIYAIFVILNMVFLNNISVVKDIIANSSNAICDQIVLALLAMSFSLVYSSPFVAIIQKVHERNIIKKKEENFKYPEYEYYREILKDVSPAILAYCHNRKINVEDNMVAILLNLELKGIIEITENKVIITKNIDELLSHEKLVLRKIDFGNYSDRRFKKLFKQYIENDMISKGYVKNEYSQETNIAEILTIISGWLIVYMLTTIIPLIAFSSLGGWILLAYFFGFIPLILSDFIQSKINVLVRSEESIDLGIKMKGMKEYIEDFSNINNNSSDMVKLFEEYVIYAIVLDIKGKLNDECKEIYNRTKKMSISNVVAE